MNEMTRAINKGQSRRQDSPTETIGQNCHPPPKLETALKEMHQFEYFSGRYLKCFVMDACLTRADWRGKNHRDCSQAHNRYYLGRNYSFSEKKIKRWKAFIGLKKAIQANCHKVTTGYQGKKRCGLLFRTYDSKGIQ